jgi:hypothetical protein
MSLQTLFKGWTDELKTLFVQRLFLDRQCRIFSNLIIRSGSKSIQIDYLIVSKYGILVIEIKDKTGWIYGKPNQTKWTQVICNEKYKFQNPLRQNYLHTKHLAEFLDIDHSKIYSLIVFGGDCEFKTPMPDNIIKVNLFVDKYTDYMRSKNEILFTDDKVDRICSTLKEASQG